MENDCVEKREEGCYRPTPEQVCMFKHDPHRYISDNVEDFIRDIHSLGECATNLYKEKAFPLGLAGVKVEIKVTAGSGGKEMELAHVVMGSDKVAHSDDEEEKQNDAVS